MGKVLKYLGAFGFVMCFIACIIGFIDKDIVKGLAFLALSFFNLKIFLENMEE
jgi:hypothetical protein